MNITKLALTVLLGSALFAFGCGDSGGGTGGNGTGGTGTGGTGTGGTGTGGTGGGPVLPCQGSPFEGEATLFCPPENLPPTLMAVLPDGISVPVTIGATPNGDVVGGETVSIDLCTVSVFDSPISVTAEIREGSEGTLEAVDGGEGSLTAEIPEATIMGMALVIDGGSGTSDFDVDEGAETLQINLTSMLVDLLITVPLELEVLLDASDDPEAPCEVQGEGVFIPVGGGGTGGSGGGGGSQS